MTTHPSEMPTLDAPTADERGMWDHVSWSTAVVMYARRHGLDPRDPLTRERIKDVFRAATPSAREAK